MEDNTFPIKDAYYTLNSDNKIELHIPVSEAEKGINTEEEHRETLEKVANNEITVDEGIAEIAEVHLQEVKDYYEKLEEVEATEQPEPIINNSIMSDIKELYTKKPISSTRDQVLEALAKDFHGKDLTKEQLEHLYAWEGEGGNYNSKDTKTGGLHEFFTPYWLCKAIGNIVKELNIKTDKVLDPATGTGRLLRYLNAKEIHGFEINKFNYDIAKVIYSYNSTMYNQAFETAFLKAPRFNALDKNSWLGKDFDLVVSNPPYGEYTGEYKGLMPRIFGRFEMLFIYLSMSLVKSGGYGIYILPQSFMNNGNMYNKQKEEIMKSCKFIDAIRLPNSIFASTDIGTDLLILQKI